MRRAARRQEQGVAAVARGRAHGQPGRSAAQAGAPTGTRRILLPLPVTTTSWASSSSQPSEAGVAVAGAARGGRRARPVRTPAGRSNTAVRTWRGRTARPARDGRGVWLSISWTASSTASAFGRRLARRGARTPSTGLAAKVAWRDSQLKKPRQPDSLRAIDVGLWPSACSLAAKRRISKWVSWSASRCGRPGCGQFGQVAAVGGDACAADSLRCVRSSSR